MLPRQMTSLSRYLVVMDNMTKSLRFTEVENDSAVDVESISNRSSNSNSESDTQSNFTPSQYSWYSSKNFNIIYDEEWKFTEDNNHIVRFFSPIPGPYLIGGGYTVAVDIPQFMILLKTLFSRLCGGGLFPNIGIVPLKKHHLTGTDDIWI